MAAFRDLVEKYVLLNTRQSHLLWRQVYIKEDIGETAIHPQTLQGMAVQASEGHAAQIGSES